MKEFKSFAELHELYVPKTLLQKVHETMLSTIRNSNKKIGESYSQNRSGISSIIIDAPEHIESNVLFGLRCGYESEGYQVTECETQRRHPRTWRGELEIDLKAVKAFQVINEQESYLVEVFKSEFGARHKIIITPQQGG